MTTAVVIATMWDGPKHVRAVDPAAPPSPGELDAIADRLTPENCGVRPVVRVIEESAIPVFVVIDPGPTCEELHPGRWRRYVRRW